MLEKSPKVGGKNTSERILSVSFELCRKRSVSYDRMTQNNFFACERFGKGNMNLPVAQLYTDERQAAPVVIFFGGKCISCTYTSVRWRWWGFGRTRWKLNDAEYGFLLSIVQTEKRMKVESQYLQMRSDLLQPIAHVWPTGAIIHMRSTILRRCPYFYPSCAGIYCAHAFMATEMGSI